MLRAFFRFVLRLFFRRIEVEGTERVPLQGPVIFVVNHPNALVDPLFLLCFAPRPIFFLAKAPLFRMPVIGAVVRAFGSIPVYRRQDSFSDVAKNRETFERASALLCRGGSLAIFPEGVSHDEPRLMRLKTGAARIALGASSQSGAPLEIVPAGLYYTWKRTFRSSALLSFGNPIPVAPIDLGADGQLPPDEVRRLTTTIEAALREQTIQYETREAADLVRRAERVFSIDADADGEPLSRQVELHRRFVEGYRRLSERNPARLEEMRSRLARFEAERRQAHLRLEHLTPRALDRHEAASLLARSLADLVWAPLGAAGIVIHYPAYRLVGKVAGLVAKDEVDVLATAKIIGAMLLFPLTWLLAAWGALRLFGPWAAAAALVLLPLSGYAALLFAERFDDVAGRARAWLSLVFSARAVQRLLAERRSIRDEMIRVADELEVGSRS
ncbi:MAG TPA: lysophospholipid acyltransferase family protein [Thermoanaerobaculia bacterium]